MQTTFNFDDLPIPKGFNTLMDYIHHATTHGHLFDMHTARIGESYMEYRPTLPSLVFENMTEDLALKYAQKFWPNARRLYRVRLKTASRKVLKGLEITPTRPKSGKFEYERIVQNG